MHVEVQVFADVAEALKELLDETEPGQLALDLSCVDNRGQTLLNWAASFGTPETLELLCSRPGADLEAGVRTCLDFAAGFGRPEICAVLLRHGANVYAVDADGLRPIDRARQSNCSGAKAVVHLLEGRFWLDNGDLRLSSGDGPCV